MRLLISVCFLYIFSSCRSIGDEVSLNLMTDELSYNFNLDSLSHRSYRNEQQRIESTNVVKFGINNKSKKKYLFLIRDKRLNNIIGIKIKIYEGNNLLKINVPLITPATNEQERDKVYAYSDYHFYLEEREIRDNFKLGDKINSNLPSSYLFQSVILHPGENYTITSLFSLPFVTENKLLDFVNPSYYEFKPDKKYYFSITYQIDAQRLKQELSPEQLKQLDDNNVEIFAGQLETKKIPIINKFKANL